MSEVSSQQLDLVFQALAHPHRRAIVHSLSLQPAAISDLANQQDLSHPAIHKHIKVLESADLIQRKKSGRVNFLALNKMSLKNAQQWLHQYQVYWGNELQSLENYVAGIEKRTN